MTEVLPWTDAEAAYLAEAGQKLVGTRARAIRDLIGAPYWECKKAVCISRGKTELAVKLLLRGMIGSAPVH